LHAISDRRSGSPYGKVEQERKVPCPVSLIQRIDPNLFISFVSMGLQTIFRMSKGQ
jgi:hypothetical protein